jgi:hypothetical protein
VEDVVAQHEGGGLVGDVRGADDERLGQPTRFGLLGVAQGEAELVTGAEQPLELGEVVRGGDQQDVPDACQHQHDNG